MNVIHIHQGSSLPEHFWKTVRQTRRFHSGRILCVVPEQDLTAPEIRELRLDAYANTTWDQAPAIRELRRVSWLKRYGLDGFWHFALERLFILAELMRQEELADALHVENDVTIYFDPAEMAKPMRQCFGSKCCAVIPAGPTDGCTAALLYAGSLQALDSVCTAVLRLLPLGEWKLRAIFPSVMVNEMTLLAVAQIQNPELVRSLPITPSQGDGPLIPRYGRRPAAPFLHMMDRISPRFATEPPPHGLSAELDTLQSLFDPSSWGMYLGGSLQGHAPGVSFPYHWIGPDLRKGRFRVEWRMDERERRFPVVIDRRHENREWKLNNLHVHSKRIDDFT